MVPNPDDELENFFCQKMVHGVMNVDFFSTEFS